MLTNKKRAVSSIELLNLFELYFAKLCQFLLADNLINCTSRGLILNFNGETFRTLIKSNKSSSNNDCQTDEKQPVTMVLGNIQT